MGPAGTGAGAGAGAGAAAGAHVILLGRVRVVRPGDPSESPITAEHSVLSLREVRTLPHRRDWAETGVSGSEGWRP